MNKNNFVYFLVLLFLLPFYSCRHIEDENHHYTIRFANNSNKAIYIASSPEYPDTTVTDCGALSQPQICKAFPKEANTSALDMNVPWELAFECRDQLPHDTLIIFVFDAEKLEEKDSNARDAFLVRYDLSLKDVQSVNWVLTYPPSENMKDIKMWPPYKKNE